MEQQKGYDNLLNAMKKLMPIVSGLSEEEQSLFFIWMKNIIIRGLSREKKDELVKVIDNSKEEPGMVYAIEEILHKEFRKRERDGMKKGMEKGMEKIVLLQLMQRITDLPDEYIKKIKKLNKEKLEQIAKDIFAIQKVEDLERYVS